MIRLLNRIIERFDSDDHEWEVRFALWRMRWFPYRTYQLLDDDSWGTARWQWPDVLRRRFRA